MLIPNLRIQLVEKPSIGVRMNSPLVNARSTQPACF